MSSPTDYLAVFPNNRPRAYGSVLGDIPAITPPVQQGLTVAYVRQHGFSAQLIDADAQGLMPDSLADQILAISPRLVGIASDMVNTGDVTKMEAAVATAQAIKRRAPHVPVMMEGIVPSAYPERTLAETGADFVCQGEPFAPVTDLLRHLTAQNRAAPLQEGEICGIWARRGDTLVRSQRSPMIKTPDSLPLPAWDLMPPEKYRAHHWHCFDRLRDRSPYAAIFTNFGCPYGCTFCSVNAVAGGPNFRAHSPDHVLQEIEILVNRYKVRNIRILDNVFTIRQDLVEEICDRIIERGYDLNFWAYARVESIRSPDLLRKMKRAGVNWLAYGIEAAHDRVRAAVDKPSNQRTIERAIEWTKEAGIHIVGNFIFGLPEDDSESMQMSLDMAKKYNFEWANFYCAMAYPGTALHEQLVAKGWAPPDKWSTYGQYSPDVTPLATRHLTSREVVAFRDQAFVDYCSSPAYLNMLKSTFGEDAVSFVKRILSVPIKRNQ